MYLISQGSGPSSINTTLADGLAAQPWAVRVSGEILALGTLRGEPVLLRGVEPGTFLALEGGVWRPPPASLESGIAVGAGLAERVGIEVGDHVSLVGSTVPRIDVLRVEGVYDAPGPARDEIIAGYRVARFLTGLGETSFHSIRVETGDGDGLLAYLRTSGASAHVTGPGLPRADVNSDPPTSDRLTNLILRSGRGAVPRDALSVAIAEATNSVRAVAWGLAGLIGLLVARGIHGVQARAFADRVASVGVLRAIGASDRWMRGRAVLEALPLATAAGLLGAAAGILFHVAVPPATLVLFGHAVAPTFDVPTVAGILGGTVLASLASVLVLLERALRDRPSESIREGVAVQAPPSLEVVLRG